MSGVAHDSANRASEVLARLARVTDPELDEPVTDLGFVTGVKVDSSGRVEVGFRLPTYWCAANFAFLMADDMRREVAALPWVTSIAVELGDHMYAETINRAMKTGLSFQDAFAEEADGDLEDIRRTFAIKSFQRRQLMLLDRLASMDRGMFGLLTLTIAGLSSLEVSTEIKVMIERYLDRRQVPAEAGPNDLAFVGTAGQAIAPEQYATYRRELRRVMVNVEFNGTLCRGLLAARFDETNSAEPTLLDFVQGAAGKEGWGSAPNPAKGHGP